MLRAVFFEDAVSIFGDVIAFAALALNQITGSSIPQGVAAVLIALALSASVFGSSSATTTSWSAPGWGPPGTQGRDVAGFTQPLRPAEEDRVRAFLLGYPGVTGIRESSHFRRSWRVWIVARVDVDDGLRGAQVKHWYAASSRA